MVFMSILSYQSTGVWHGVFVVFCTFFNSYDTKRTRGDTEGGEGNERRKREKIEKEMQELEREFAAVPISPGSPTSGIRIGEGEQGGRFSRFSASSKWRDCLVNPSACRQELDLSTEGNFLGAAPRDGLLRRQRGPASFAGPVPQLAQPGSVPGSLCPGLCMQGGDQEGGRADGHLLQVERDPVGQLC